MKNMKDVVEQTAELYELLKGNSEKEAEIREYLSLTDIDDDNRDHYYEELEKLRVLYSNNARITDIVRFINESGGGQTCPPWLEPCD